MSLNFVSIIKLITRIAAVHKATVSTMYETIFPAVDIEPTKAIIFLLVNIKPMRPTISISRTHQVYRVFEDYQEAAVYLIAW